MIRRDRYLAQIRPFIESDLIKIITGIRRCGKSVLLRELQEEISATGKNCLFLNFELRSTRALIPDADALIRHLNTSPLKREGFPGTSTDFSFRSC